MVVWTPWKLPWPLVGIAGKFGNGSCGKPKFTVIVRRKMRVEMRLEKKNKQIINERHETRNVQNDEEVN